MTYASSRVTGPHRPSPIPRVLALLAAAVLPAILPAAVRAERIAPNDPRIQLSGRWDTKNAGPTAAWSASTVRFRLSGVGCSAVMTTSGNDYLAVCIDGKFTTKMKLGKSQDPVVIADKLEPGEHEVELIKATEPSVGVITFAGLELPAGATLTKPAPLTRRIEFIGDSITTGYGNEDDNRSNHFKNETENAALTYGVLTARKLKADWTCVAVSGICLSPPKKGDPMPTLYPRLSPRKGGAWDFTRMVPDAVVINLGTNDSGAKPFDADKYRGAWAPFVAVLRRNYPKALIFCTVGPMGRRKQIEECIEQAVADINQAGDAKVYAVKLPVQDEKIDGIGADWHPTVKCHQRVADNLAPILAEKLNWKE